MNKAKAFGLLLILVSLTVSVSSPITVARMRDLPSAHLTEMTGAPPGHDEDSSGVATATTDDVPPPLPTDCDGVGPPIPACCLFGYVYYDDATVAGVAVHIESPHGTLDTLTTSGWASDEPYYVASLSTSPLNVSPGDVITITASYSDMVSTRTWTVQSAGQHVDLGLVAGFQSPGSVTGLGAGESESESTVLHDPSQTAAAAPQGIPLTFIENVGQFDERARFQVRNGDTTLFLAKDALWVTMIEPSSQPVSTTNLEALATAGQETEMASNRRVNLKLSFVGANPHPRLEPFDKSATRVSFFTGNDPDRWHTDVPAWGGVRYVDLYPGVDLELRGQNGRLEQRLVVRESGSDLFLASHNSHLSDVRLRVDGVEDLVLDGNHLKLTTALGDLALPLLVTEGTNPDAEPAVWKIEDETYEVSSPFAPASSFTASVSEAAGGASALSYSTYLGGSGEDRPYDIALDSEGNVHIVGETSSTDFPITPGAYNASYGGDPIDVFVTKLSADGSTLVYSTYLGGNDEDAGNGITVDSAGNVYLTGKTYSTNFPTTPGALDTTLSGGRDAFVAKLNAAGDALIYSTYLGGTSWDYGFCIAIDDSDNAYVGGFTHGSFPVTSGAAQTTFGGSGDGFVVKLGPDGRTLLYSTYLGGYSWEGIASIAIDNTGNAYLASHTHSTDFPTTPGAWDRVCDNCQTNFSTDAAVAKLNADGSAFIYSTLIGGADAPGGEAFTDISTDSAGNAYLTGHTSSTDFPTTTGALQPDFGGGGDDAVVVKLNADGSDLLYSTYLGGSDADRGYSIAIDGDGTAYLTGYTASTDFATVDPLQASNAGGYDAFVAKVNDAGSALLYSTYLGGSGDEICFNPPLGHAEIALDRTRNIYLAGSTGSTDFPTTTGAYDSSFNGGNQDLFVTKLNTNSTFVEINTGDIVNDGGSSSGACWGDYDSDGWLDLFVTNWRGENNFLYHNNGDGSFTKIISGAIVNDGGWSRSCTWGDYDNDGRLDLFVSNDGGGNFLYHNEGGGTFARITSGPIASDGGNCYGTMWVDYDNDGWLDLFVARHTNADNLLYHNNGDGSFAKITDGDIVNDGGYSHSASWGDYDSDGCLDLFVGNVNDPNNFLYHNNCDGTFSRITSGAIATDGGFSRSSNWVDYDNDEDLDLFVGNWGAENFLYRNNGSGTFTSIITGTIVTDGYVHHSSWGDFDNDGDMDLFAGPEDRRDDNPIYQNNGDGTFTKAITGTIASASGRSGPNWADYDNDGDLDLFIAVSTGNNSLFQNSGNDNHWINIKGIGTVSNKAAIGARVTATATFGGVPVQQLREISGQTGMYSQNSLNVEFGLGDAAIVDSIVVKWPSGIVQVLENVAVDQFLIVTETISPTAAFSAFPLSGTVPLDVRFTDQSTGDIIAWDWTFGDGGISGARHPEHEYTDTGSFTISLTVRGPGGSDAETKPHYVSLILPTWTFMLYLDGDNSLDRWLEQSFNRLQAASANPHVAIVVQIDGSGSADTWRYKIQPGADHSWYMGELDMGDPQTLSDFVLWAREAYSADYTYLAVADHGRGTTGIAWDETTGSNEFITVTELQIALRDATNDGAEPLDVVHYDACLMAMLEDAYQIKYFTRYLVASENLAWGAFAYDAYATPVTTTTTPLQMATTVADAYHRAVSGLPHTISALDIGEVSTVADAVTDLATALQANLSVNRYHVSNSRSATQKFDSRDYFRITNDDEYLDLYDLARWLKQNVPDNGVKDAAQGVMDAVDAFVVAEWHQSGVYRDHPYWDLGDAHGVSIYFPREPGGWDYDDYMNHVSFRFTIDEQWDDFLQAYYGVIGLPPEDPIDPGLPPVLEKPYKIYLPFVVR